jgi:hypothetical protein
MVLNRTDTSALIIVAIGLLGLPNGNAMADDLLGIYVGGWVGQSHVRSDQVLFFKPDGTPRIEHSFGQYFDPKACPGKLYTGGLRNNARHDYGQSADYLLGQA